ncbi:hypothetical protein ACIRRA_10715 [Nocardia sp. NPDC101769]
MTNAPFVTGVGAQHGDVYISLTRNPTPAYKRVPETRFDQPVS